ncbi:MAG: hypothetical protein LBE02_06865 [Spirochaetaceae bacterium]|nr:hypothetical protein [Spirochaetaceae bacterium]
MFSKEIFSFLIKVITSWEVIVVTVVLILYFTLVFYVARLYHYSPGLSFGSKPKRAKKTGAAAKTPIPQGTEDDDLGIEEE